MAIEANQEMEKVKADVFKIIDFEMDPKRKEIDQSLEMAFGKNSPEKMKEAMTDPSSSPGK